MAGAHDTNAPELRHDGRLRAATLVHQLHRGVLVGEGKAPFNLHPKGAIRLGYVGPGGMEQLVII